MATCTSADSVLEAAALIKTNGTKLDTFVNGTSTQTVQLGTGDPTPTIRKFIADAQSTVATAANDAAQTVLDDVADMMLNKADKVVGAVSGNLACLDETGNVHDAGRAAEDFVPLLAYANDEAMELTWQNRVNIDRYSHWYDAGLRHLGAANIDTMKTVQAIRDMMTSFDEGYAQHRLMQRLLGGTNPVSPSKPVLFIVSGQSNAVGWGDYTPYDRAVDCGWFWSWHDGADELRPLADPIGNVAKGSGWCQFARRFFALTGRRVILLSIGNGSSVVTDGPTNSWAASGTLRTSRQAIWDAFSAAVPASEYEVGGILWDQGGTDAARLNSGEITVNDFKDGTVDTWTWHRQLVGDADCKIFAALIDYRNINNAALNAARKQIMDATYDLCINGGDANVHLGFTIAPEYIKAPELYMSDVVHYSRYGYKVQGNSFARSAAHFLDM